MSFGPPKPVSSSEDRIGSDALTFSYTSSDRLVKHSQNSGHSSLEYPALSPFTPPCVSLASCGAEHRDPPQPLSVDAIATGFERDRPTNRGKGAPDGHLTIPANCRSPTSDKVHTEIPTINECSEDIGDMPARSESSQGTDHSSSSLSAATASSPPPPSALKATSGRAATKAEHAPLRWHMLGRLVINHRKTVSTASTVFTTVGDIVLSPGFSTCVSGTVLAHPAVIIAGAIASTVGRWLRSRLDSTEASTAVQAQPSGQEAV